jgi:hypothetical protein
VLSKAYLVLGIAILSLYSVGEFMGWEYTGPGRETPQAAHARHASGGSRSHFWYFGGYRGGK